MPESVVALAATPGAASEAQPAGDGGVDYVAQQRQLARRSRESGHAHSYARAAAAASKGVHALELTPADAALHFAREDSLRQERGAVQTPQRQGASSVEKRERREEERQRHINEDLHHQFWTQLDLSGQGLCCVSPRLQQYAFLQRLYLNHNALARVPACVCKLTQLRVLDLSGNQLTALPAELGLLYNLRVLLLFDNALQALPAALGMLFQLQFLGLLGNPVLAAEPALRDQLAAFGTRGLVQYLRDGAPAGPAPAPRVWVRVDDEANADHALSLMSYNTLCDSYATSQLYGYTPQWALPWDYRSQLLLEEVLARDTDVVCLQEVSTAALEELWFPILQARGYKVLFYTKTRARTMAKAADARLVDGCATFYKVSKFTLLEKFPIEYNSKALLKDDLKKSTDIFNRVMTRDNIAIVGAFEHVATKRHVLIANTHLHWDPALNDVKLVQTALLLEETEAIARRYARKHADGDLKRVPVLIAGDFNSTANSGVVQLFNQSSIPATHVDMDGHSYGNFTEKGIKHNLALKSAYAEDSQLPFTNFTPAFVEVIDYIVYTTPTLKVNALLGPVDREYASRYIGFPNAHHPSDHISIAARFEFI